MKAEEILLSVSIILIVFLLISCWCNKSISIKRRENMTNNPDSEAPWGQGKKNKQLDEQNEFVAEMGVLGDYNNTMKMMSLEPEVFDSHTSFSDQHMIANSGASMMTEMSHDEDINPRVGLRRTDYNSIYAESDARVVPSEFQNQMPNKTNYIL